MQPSALSRHYPAKSAADLDPPLQAQIAHLSQELDLTKQALNQSYDQLQSVYFWAETTDNINRATTLDSVYATTLLGLQQVFNTPQAAISLLDASDVFQWQGHSHLSTNYLETMAEYCPWTNQEINPQPIVIPVVASPDLPERILQKQRFLLSEGIHTLIWLPMLQQAQLIGQLGIFYRQVTPVDDALIHLAQILVNSMVFAVERKKSETQLRKTLEKLHQMQVKLVQNEKMSSLGQLVAGVAHEINNPVGFIYGNLRHIDTYAHDLLKLVRLYDQRQPNPTDDIADLIEEIDLAFLMEDFPKTVKSAQVGAERIREIVKSLRTFSRLDESDLKSVDLHEGIDSTLMILKHRLRAADQRPGIEIINDYGQLPLVSCYASPLNQVFMNILANAIDAFDEAHTQGKIAASPCITIRTEVLERGDIQISITDNGPGIPETVLPKIFDPFFTTKAVGKGTGMGMSISYQIITETHGGKLTCTSKLGMGAKFVIQIPSRQE
ncbi:MAG: ATP-binding protein [Leptolyngbyaceae cyanobacterium MO_188.B28]|nr:ATP-binding protein [Leptolyngbyaceae cyanobacterium MO_188.B28]